MKYPILIVLMLLSFLGRGQELILLHTNDMHSHLNGLSPEAEYTPLINDNDPTAGGFSRIAGFIKGQRFSTQFNETNGIRICGNW